MAVGLSLLSTYQLAALYFQENFIFFASGTNFF
jgi:hypothetical protein